MILFIKTTDSNTAYLALIGDNFVAKSSVRASKGLSERLLPAILKLLRRQKKSLDKVSKVVVVSGPGSFTSLRTGVAVANALSYALGAPLVGVQASRVPTDLRKLRELKGLNLPVHPYYGRPPHLTRPKKQKL